MLKYRIPSFIKAAGTELTVILLIVVNYL